MEGTAPASLIVLPVYGGRSESIDSFVLDAVGLAGGLERAYGDCDVLTPEGLMDRQGVARGVSRPAAGASVTGSLVRKLPRSARVALGDARSMMRGRRMRNQAALLNGRRYGFVVQKHRRFHDSGLRIARERHVPYVLKLDALEVREEASWGVTRPGWGSVVERFGEVRLIREADLVLPVSRTLDGQLASLGLPDRRRLVLDNGVDLEAFSPGPADADLRREFGLQGRLVVGWVGSFRPFHGLSLVPEIARRLRGTLPDAVLCLVGTGDLFASTKAGTDDLRETVRLVGPVPHDKVTHLIRAFDICLLLAEPGPYHYSPLKLYEYMACGRPVVAAAVGDVARVVDGDAGTILVPPGDPGAVADAIARLAVDPALRVRMGQEARRTAERLGGWDVRARTLVDGLRDRALLV